MIKTTNGDFLVLYKVRYIGNKRVKMRAGLVWVDIKCGYMNIQEYMYTMLLNSIYCTVHFTVQFIFYTCSQMRP